MGSKRDDMNWASDEDANDLLAGILDETEEEARSEEQRLQDELEARAEAERREQEQEKARKRAEAKARITAEEERLEGLEKRRTMRQEALRIEEMKERGDYVEPKTTESEADEQLSGEPGEERRKSRVKGSSTHLPEVAVEPVRPAADATQERVVAAPRPSRAPLFGLVAVALLVAGAGIAAFALTTGQYEHDTSTYTKAVYKPVEARDMQVSVGFTPIREQESADADENEARRVTRSQVERPTSSEPDREPSRPEPEPSQDDTSEESSAPELPDFDDSSFDPFSEGP